MTMTRLVVATLISVLVPSAFQFDPAARAAEPETAAGAPPAPDPGAVPPAPSVSALTVDETGATFRAPGRAQTMDEVATGLTAELSIRNVRSRYTLNFFGDTSLSAGSPAGTDHHLGFAIGAQDVLIKGELGKHLVALTEFAVESGDAGFGIDVERFSVRWQSGPFYLEAGRTHTALGYWNNAYHHGRWLQLAIARPRWVAFEDSGGLLPVHWVGVTSGAKLNLGTGTLNLMASIGNGRGKIVDDVRNTGDYQSLKALQIGAEYVGLHWPDLRIGIGGVLDRIPAQSALDRPALPNQSIDEIIGSAHAAYASVPLLLVAESYLVIHRAAGQQWSTYGGFLLVGYSFGPWTPYVEVERIASSGGADPFFAPDRAAAGIPSFDTLNAIGGVRLDLSDWTALKAEYRHTSYLDSSSSTLNGFTDRARTLPGDAQNLQTASWITGGAGVAAAAVGGVLVAF
jgi:hypothetical protein